MTPPPSDGNAPDLPPADHGPASAPAGDGDTTGTAVARAALERYLRARAEAWQRWKQRGLVVGYGAGAVAFLVSMMVGIDAYPDWAFLISIFVALAVTTSTVAIIYPRIQQPTVPCPHCAQRVGLAETQVSPFTPIKPLRHCPHCKGPLV